MARRNEPFDLVVIGTGVAGAAIASGCREAGWRVAIVDARPFGGTCALRGCDPKRVLVGAAEAVAHARRAGGVRSNGGPALDWPALIAFERSFTEPVPSAREKAFAEQGIEAIRGRARFARDGSLAVDGRRLSAPHVAVAAGARPRPLGIPGEEHLITSDAFMALGELPRRIVFAGGGYVAFELAHVARQAGAEVTLLVRGDRALRRFDPQLARRLVEKSRRLGMEIRFGEEVVGVEAGGGEHHVRVRTSRGERRLAADLVVHGAGRTADLDDLGLDAVEVDWNESGVRVDSHLRSLTNPAVYAAGDAAAGGPPLTPKAGHDAQVVVANLLEGTGHVRVDYAGIPTVLFSIPPLASVGLQEEEAKAAGLAYRVHEEDTGDWYESRRLREDTAAHRVVVEEETDRILGAHLLGPHAHELINLFALAMQADLRAPDLRSTLFAYPTAASAVAHML